MKIGPYEVQRSLGSMVVDVETEPEPQFAMLYARAGDVAHRYDAKMKRGPAAGTRTVTLLNLGVSATNISDMIEADSDFAKTLSAEVKVALKKGFEFHRVSLVANFRASGKLKFRAGSINVKLRNPSSKAIVHSIAPIEVKSKEKVSKKFGLDPTVKLLEVELSPGVSYTDVREYEKLHPLITGHFALSNYADWDFHTNKSVERLQGTQIVELVVKQKKGVKSVWSAVPKGEQVSDGNKIVRAARWVIGKAKGRSEEGKPSKFTVPLD